MSKDIKYIKINWASPQSIMSAEAQKAKLEHDGWTLVGEQGGLYTSMLIYKKT